MLLGKNSIYEVSKISKLSKTQPASCQSTILASQIHLESGIVRGHMEIFILRQLYLTPWLGQTFTTGPEIFKYKGTQKVALAALPVHRQ